MGIAEHILIRGHHPACNNLLHIVFCGFNSVHLIELRHYVLQHRTNSIQKEETPTTKIAYAKPVLAIIYELDSTAEILRGLPVKLAELRIRRHAGMHSASQRQ